LLLGIFDDLENYAKYHFLTEKKYFDEFHYANSKEHKDEHVKFAQEISKIKIDFKADSIAT